MHMCRLQLWLEYRINAEVLQIWKKPHQHPEKKTDPVPFPLLDPWGRFLIQLHPPKTKQSPNALMDLDSTPLGGCRCMDLDGLLGESGWPFGIPTKRNLDVLVIWILLVGGLHACASWGQGFWIQGPKKGKRPLRGIGSGMPLVQVLGHTPEALKERKLLWSKNASIARVAGGCLKQGG